MYCRKFPTSRSYAIAREAVDEVSKENLSAYHEEWKCIDGEGEGAELDISEGQQRKK